MKILALTGGISSGKTTVAQLFQKHGAIFLDADRIAHEVYKPATTLYREIIKRYGKNILGASRRIDRKKLAKILFQSPVEKIWLEKKIHPAVRRLIKQRIQAAIRRRPPLILVEAALHVETGYYRDFQGLLVVKTPRRLQLKRLTECGHLSRREALLRIKNQMPLSTKLKVADYVIDNSGSLAKTARQVNALMKRLKE
jgi:dephospho-CoA kinase